MEEDENAEEPKYTDPSPQQVQQQNVSTFSKEEFEDFWVPICETTDTENLTSQWINDVRKALMNASPVQEDHPIIVNREVINKCLQKKKNWSSPGLDRITNYWLKFFTSLHISLASAISSLINHIGTIPEWLSEGRTILIPKKNDPSLQDFRPITCLNTMYKLTTPIINIELESHELKHQLMQIFQEEV